MNTEVYESKLKEELAVITTQLQDMGIHNPRVPEDWIATPEGQEAVDADPNITADRTEDWIERNAEVADLETRYVNILRALKKLDDGTYGVCEIGEEPIEEDRLNANPAARTCKAHINEEDQLPR